MDIRNFFGKSDGSKSKAPKAKKTSPEKPQAKKQVTKNEDKKDENDTDDNFQEPQFSTRPVRRSTRATRSSTSKPAGASAETPKRSTASKGSPEKPSPDEPTRSTRASAKKEVAEPVTTSRPTRSAKSQISPEAKPRAKKRNVVIESDEDDNDNDGDYQVSEEKDDIDEADLPEDIDDTNEEDEVMIQPKARSKPAVTPSKKRKVSVVVDSPKKDEAPAPRKRAKPVKEEPKDTVMKEAEADEQPKKKPNFWAYKNKTGPKAPGSKEVPEGAENCLLGLTFVFTGELSSISREEATDLVKRYGGRVTGAPSSKTTYVVVGDDPGESKLKKVKQLKIKTIDEDGLFELVRDSPGKGDPSMSDPAKGKKSAIKIEKLPDIPATVRDANGASKPVSQLWTDKYAPKELKDLCGNKTNIQRLTTWLREWKQSRKNKFSAKGKDSTANFRAVLLSGPPGIGKTSAAHLVSKAEGYQVLEFNASDARSKKSIDSTIRELTGNRSMTEYFTSSASKASDTGKPQVIVMDEVDGMSAGDRGGVAELILIIKKTQVPIICICNDRQSPKVRSLANYCLDLRFRRPEAASIRSRIMSIAYKEGLSIQANVVDQLVAIAQSDIRQVLNLISTWSLSEKSMSYDAGKQYAKAAEKHISYGPFEIVGKYLNGQNFNSANLNEKIEIYFHDFSLAPLMIQENYIKMNPSLAREGRMTEKQVMARTLDLISQAADSISDGDLVDSLIHGSQQWGLMPVHATFSCVRPAYFTHGASQGMYQFPGWLGQNSKAGKYSRMLKELQIHMRTKISGDKNEVRMGYVPTLATALSQPLIDQGADAIPSVMELMDEYYINKEDWDGLIDMGVGSFSGEKILSKIPTSVKSNFTRTYNKMSHPTPFLKPSGVKAGRGAASEPVPDLEDVVDTEDVVEKESEDASDEETIEDDKLIKQKKAPASKAKATSTRGRGRGKATTSRSRK
ncbi:DNA replication factor C, large subunit [Basidiobolus meristosporus CBS 931.73]|uniref:Replication factor C subunit 1 n=1 Tax=Basidiobolus meristosporus CBS 931.73 TaxID=1314790 RepID=A0A1Y1XZW2_9FUNG|nr:DNA replication factor C, large subunit [Basidiobolus meristosporus CBS 931.73]|eukprot:ORX91282.1 DNA replication factor C, large subunit [Basidiobolus meristosporus CBS 931.73]